MVPVMDEESSMRYPDMTNARAAVYALQEPLVKACPELTVDRVIADYTVSAATREHEREPQGLVRAGSWRELVRHRVSVCCEYGNAGQHPRAVY